MRAISGELDHTNVRQQKIKIVQKTSVEQTMADEGEES